MRHSLSVFLQVSMLVLVFGLTACATAVVGGAAEGTYGREDGRSNQQLTEDARITSEVRQLIYRDGELADAEIRVNTRNGIVTLSGRVAHAGHIRRATGLARSVEGVKGIDMQLTICSGSR